MQANPLIAVAARVLLALMFVLGGLSKFAAIGGTAGYIASKGLPMPTVLALAAAVLEFGGGLALMLGYRTRSAALALFVFTLLASLLFHNFWTLPADQQMMQQLMFMKNLSVAGGLLLLFSFGAGAASLDARLEAVRLSGRAPGAAR